MGSAKRKSAFFMQLHSNVVSLDILETFKLNFCSFNFPSFDFRDLVEARLLCIFLCSNTVQTFSSRSIVTPRHRYVIMHEGVGHNHCVKHFNIRQNVPQHCYLLDTLAWSVTDYCMKCSWFSATESDALGYCEVWLASKNTQGCNFKPGCVTYPRCMAIQCHEWIN